MRQLLQKHSVHNLRQIKESFVVVLKKKTGIEENLQSVITVLLKKVRILHQQIRNFFSALSVVTVQLIFYGLLKLGF